MKSSTKTQRCDKKKKELVYSMRSKTGSIVWPQLGMCNSGNQNFSLLCTCPPMTGHATVWFGHTNTFLWIGKFANMESSNNEDQLYLFVWKNILDLGLIPDWIDIILISWFRKLRHRKF